MVYRSKPGLSMRERIEKRLDKTSSGCWLWTGAISGGYGHIGVNRKIKLVHRVYWEELNGPIPEGMCLCHKCDIPNCVNPKHLFIGTHTENMRDSLNKGRHYLSNVTHCKNNHLFDETNTLYIVKTGRRRCKTCARQIIKRWRLNRRRKHER